MYSSANYYSGTSVYGAVSQGTVTLTGSTTIDTRKAYITDANGAQLAGTQTWQLGNFLVSVTPHGGLAAPSANLAWASSLYNRSQPGPDDEGRDFRPVPS